MFQVQVDLRVRGLQRERAHQGRCSPQGTLEQRSGSGHACLPAFQCGPSVKGIKFLSCLLQVSRVGFESMLCCRSCPLCRAGPSRACRFLSALLAAAVGWACIAHTGFCLLRAKWALLPKQAMDVWARLVCYTQGAAGDQQGKPSLPGSSELLPHSVNIS